MYFLITAWSRVQVLAGPLRRNGLRSIQKARFGGLFSYRSVIPPSPQKTLLRRLSRGPHLFHPAYPAGCFAFCAAKRWQAGLEQGGGPQPAKTVQWTVFSPRVVLAGPLRRNGLRSIQKARFGGLFSYCSVIPPSPQKTLLRRLSRGPHLFHPAYPAGCFAFCAAKRWQAGLEQGGGPQPAKTVQWTVFSPRVVLAGLPSGMVSA